MNVNDTYLTTAEVAQHLGVTVRRVQKPVQDGWLPAIKRGRDYLIRRDDLSFLADRRTGHPINGLIADESIQADDNGPFVHLRTGLPVRLPREVPDDAAIVQERGHSIAGFV